MQVRPTGSPCVSGIGDYLTLLHELSILDGELLEMAVIRLEAEAVDDNQEIPEAAGLVVTGELYDAIGGRHHRSARVGA